MYITRVKICLFNPEGMKALASPHIMHGIISASFPSGYERNTSGVADPGKTPLWRVDSKDRSRYLLLVSNKEPDKRYLADHLGDQTDESVETKEYDSLIDRIKEGATYRFKADLNPTACFTDDAGKRHRIPLLPENEKRNSLNYCSQEKWFNYKAENAGFSVNDMMTSGNETMNFKKGPDGERVSFLKTTFEGTLTVTDRDKFITTLKAGIGREKAYGCGMLSIAST